MRLDDWAMAAKATAAPALVAELRRVWRTEVLPRFAAAYRFTI
jgi:hypothetical protein